MTVRWLAPKNIRNLTRYEDSVAETAILRSSRSRCRHALYGRKHDAVKTQNFEQFPVGWKSVPAFVDLVHLNRSRVQVCFQQKFANSGPRTKRFAPEGSRESLVFLGRFQSDALWRCT
jgi:hypothetical protein